MERRSLLVALGDPVLSDDERLAMMLGGMAGAILGIGLIALLIAEHIFGI
jgi:hypothetical protein